MTHNLKKRMPGRWRAALAIIITVAVVAGVCWQLIPRKMWTDDHRLHVSDSGSRPREVLWDIPKSLGEPFDDDQQHYEPCVSSDGTELFFVSGKPGHNADIYVSYRRNNAWTRAEPLTAVNSTFDDLGPRLTADGKYLLFYSDRPGGFGGYDVWASARTADGWGKPFNLGPTVNSEFNEFTPDPTPDGKHLIFSTNRAAAKSEQIQPWRATVRENQPADYDLWIADMKEAESEPVSLAVSTLPATRTASVELQNEVATLPATQPARSLVVSITCQDARVIPGINTPYVEGASCMSPAGDFLYFASNRPGGFGKFDIWRSRVTPDWIFGPAENVGPEINSANNETDPSLAVNGYRLVFSSDRGSDRGVYNLFTSDSREVYSVREGRALPHLGLSFWLFLATLIVLIPLLLFLHGMDAGRLDLLQKCLLISLIAHLLFCLALSFVWVSQDAIHYIRQHGGGEVTLDLSGSPELEVGTSIRRQSMSDLPTRGAAPQAVPVVQTPVETLMAHGPVDVALPRATMPPEMTKPLVAMERTLPRIPPNTIAAQPTAPPLLLSQNNSVSVRLSAPHALTQTDISLKAEAEIAPIKTTIELPATDPPLLQTTAAPKAQASAVPLPVESTLVPTPTLSRPAEPRATQVSLSSPNERPEIAMHSPMAPKVAGYEAAPALASAVSSPISPKSLQIDQADAQNNVAKVIMPPAAPVQPGAETITRPLVQTPAALRTAAVAGPPVETATLTLADLAAPTNMPIVKSNTTKSPAASGAPNAPVAQAENAEIKRLISAPTDTPTAPINVTTPKAAIAPGSAMVASVVPRPVNFADHATAPTTLPTTIIAGAAAMGAESPQVNIGPLSHPAQRVAEDWPLQPGVPAVGPTSRPVDVATTLTPSTILQKVTPVAGPVLPGSGTSSNTPAIVPRPIPRAVAPAPAPMPQQVADGGDGPVITLPKHAPALATPYPASSGAGDRVPQPAAVAMTHQQQLHGSEGGGTENSFVEIASPIPAGMKLPANSRAGLDPISIHRGPITVAPTFAPQVSIAPFPKDIGAGKLNAPDSPFRLRAPEMHKPIIEKLGGTKASEDAVAGALLWLSSHQEEDGRWTIVSDQRTEKRQLMAHDHGLTGLSILAFLAQDHRPDQPGPYRDTASRALDYLVSHQRPDGDLRGNQPGNSAALSNMYDQGIASYAVAEAAAMTHDPKYVNAALLAADFIARAQNAETGGWRYAPGESGDSSVFGWQVMALHSAERVGFKIPEHTREGIEKYIHLVATGEHHMLCGYLPHGSPTAAMTSQIAFTQMLLGRQFEEVEMNEAADFLSHTPPGENAVDLYYWYYASLCMSQMHTPAWTDWNTKTRNALIALKKSEGEHGNYWEPRGRHGGEEGRVLPTALAALTLEVYYRYMPLQDRNVAPKAN